MGALPSPICLGDLCRVLADDVVHDVECDAARDEGRVEDTHGDGGIEWFGHGVGGSVVRRARMRRSALRSSVGNCGQCAVNVGVRGTYFLIECSSRVSFSSIEERVPFPDLPLFQSC